MNSTRHSMETVSNLRQEKTLGNRTKVTGLGDKRRVTQSRSSPSQSPFQWKGMEGMENHDCSIPETG
jgi:hypothetical protein